MKKAKGNTPKKAAGNLTATPKSDVKKPRKPSLKPNSQTKNVRFDCKDSEKEHIKYAPTPFSSAAKKTGKRLSKTDTTGTKKKLKFDEADNKTIAVKNEKVTTSENVKKGVKRKLKNEDASAAEKKLKKEVEDNDDGSVDTDNTLENVEFKGENAIFVGNVPITYDHKKIQKFFSKFGKVKSARIRSVSVASLKVPKKESAIRKKYHPKRNSVNAYVVFESKDSVQKAIAENGMVLDDHHLRIDYAEPQKRDFKKSVFVGGLPFDIQDEDLWKIFSDCGEIESVRVVRDNKIGMGKGIGYVNFSSAASVELALKLNGHEIGKRKINVQRCKDTQVIQKKSKKKAKKGKRIVAVQNKKPVVAKPEGGNDFQGKKAEQKKKKKKSKRSKEAVRKNKIKSALLSKPSKKTKTSK